jgi:hypothetical protein
VRRVQPSRQRGGKRGLSRARGADDDDASHRPIVPFPQSSAVALRRRCGRSAGNGGAAAPAIPDNPDETVARRRERSPANGRGDKEQAVTNLARDGVTRRGDATGAAA